MSLATRRSWTRAAGVVPVTAATTMTAGICAVAVATGSGRVAQSLALSAALLIGALTAFVLWRTLGPDAVHRAVADARAAWARGASGVDLVPDGAADPTETELALPRGWRVLAARGRLREHTVEPPARVETWVLRAAHGSQRASRRREVVVVPVVAGDTRMTFSGGPGGGRSLVTPGWASDIRVDDEPSWAAAVRRRIEQQEDLPISVTVGQQRVLVFAMDDPRTQTARSRIDLARDIAEIVGRQA